MVSKSNEKKGRPWKVDTADASKKCCVCVWLTCTVRWVGSFCKRKTSSRSDRVWMSRGWPAVWWYCCCAPIFTWKRRFIIIAAKQSRRRSGCRRENGSTAFTNYHPPLRVICHEAITKKERKNYIFIFLERVFFFLLLLSSNRIKSKQCGDGTKTFVHHATRASLTKWRGGVMRRHVPVTDYGAHP